MKLDIKTLIIKVFIKYGLKSSWNKEKFDIQLDCLRFPKKYLSQLPNMESNLKEHNGI